MKFLKGERGSLKYFTSDPFIKLKPSAHFENSPYNYERTDELTSRKSFFFYKNQLKSIFKTEEANKNPHIVKRKMFKKPH